MCEVDHLAYVPRLLLQPALLQKAERPATGCPSEDVTASPASAVIAKVQMFSRARHGQLLKGLLMLVRCSNSH